MSAKQTREPAGDAGVADGAPSGAAPTTGTLTDTRGRPVRRTATSRRLDTALGWSPTGLGSRTLRSALCAVALLIFAAPFITILSGSINRQRGAAQLAFVPGDPTLENFTVAGERGIWGYFANSMVIVGGGLLLQIVLSILAAYALSRFTFRGRGIVMSLFLLTMMLPEEVIAVPLGVIIGDVPLLGVSLRGNPLGVILPVAVWGFSVFMMAQFMKDVPKEIEEAALLDGVGRMRMLWQIILPLSIPALGVITIFGFQMIWNQYLLPLIVANDQSDYTLTVALSVLRSDVTVGSGVVLAGAVIALVPSLVVYLLMQRSMIQGMTAGAVKG